ALAFLYLTMLPTTLYYTFPKLPFKNYYLQQMSTLTIATLYFALLHMYFAFFKQLGGFEGLWFLSTNYLVAVSLGFASLVILFLLTIISFDFIKTKFSIPKLALLNKSLYLVGLLILIHACMLGTHFQKMNEMVPQIIFISCGFLFLLEANRIDIFLQKRNIFTKHFGISMTVTIGLLFCFFLFTYLPTNTIPSMNVHSQHQQLARLAQSQNTQFNNSFSQIPGLRGDRTKRFTVSFDHSENTLKNEEVTLSFRINDAANGTPVKFFEKLYEKPMHLIVVDQSLLYFSHIHPQQTEEGFTITTQFPHNGIYHIYIDFQPYGAIEQQFAFTLPIGDTTESLQETKESDMRNKKTFGNFAVTLNHPQPLEATTLSIGEQELSFTIKDAKTKNPITTLKPYLASFGHLVMINQKTYEYLHVHPTNLTAPKPNENGGPTVSFLPLGLYGPIKPGIYRVFAQFNPDNTLFTADFTIKVD
ncbi:MAG: hypothetical protein KBD46_03090, partial [Candidatus Levybacteria bacterium]|nr:hypothetical protein [Candidatus Levybacteria bacterium]